MIDSVRNTVLSIISKDNRGYITPMEFNLFAKQAQMEIFDGLMNKYSAAINAQNARSYNAGYTDIPKKLTEAIEIFSTYGTLQFNTTFAKFLTPINCYYLDKVLYNNTVEVEKVSHSKIHNLLASNIAAPTVSYPVYTMDRPSSTGTNDTFIQLYPLVLNSASQFGFVTAQYIRYPLDPVWTYSSLSNGDPVFNPNPAIGYRDFELSEAYEADLVLKILQYAGVSIRESEVVQAAKTEELQNIQEKG
jgi:hypothetical protein